jgi:hypothetical protein
LNGINKDRQGEAVNLDHIRSAIMCFIEMGMKKGDKPDEPKTIREAN